MHPTNFFKTLFTQGYFWFLLLSATLLVIGKSSIVEAKSKKDHRVYVGVYLADISGFNLNTGRFKGDILMWVKWLGTDKAPPVKLANAEIESRQELTKESDGDWRTVRWRIQGTFRGTFDVADFPFDKQTLKIQFELPKEEGTLVPDLSGSGMANQFSITGWEYEKFFAAEIGTSYHASDFGSIQREGIPLNAHLVSFNLEMKRPILAYLVKFMLPILVIIAMAIMVFFIPARHIDVRTAMGVTALLSVVAFQFSQAGTIPNVSYLVTADKIFLGTYLIILISLVVSVLVYNMQRKLSQVPMALKIDKYSAYGFIFVTIAGAILISLPRTENIEVPVKPILYAKKLPIASSKDELLVGVARMTSATSNKIQAGLLQRGLGYEANGKKVPFLAVDLPKLTNEYVRMLPDGGMVVIWKIRKNLFFSDGKPITIEDIAFSADVVEIESRRSVEIIDEQTIEIDFKDRNGRYLESFPIYPKAATEALIAKVGKENWYSEYGKNPFPGDGPYRVKEFVNGKYILLERNPYFAGKPPSIEKIRLSALNETTVAEEFEQGISHLARIVHHGSLGKIKKAKTGKVEYYPSDKLYFLQPDLTKKPFNDPLVRQAILHAIDRKKTAELIFLDKHQVAHSYRPQWTDDFNNNIPKFEYNPQKSKQILRRAGYKLPVKIKFISSKKGVMNPERAVVLFLVNSLKKGGFDVKLEWRKRTFKDWAKGEHGGLLFFNRSGDSVLRYWNIPYVPGDGFQASKPVRVMNQNLIDMVQRFETSLYVERKLAISTQLQKEWVERLPLIPLFHPFQNSVTHNDLVGWDPQGGKNHFWNVENWYFK